jgi:hypothetical protein
LGWRPYQPAYPGKVVRLKADEASKGQPSGIKPAYPVHSGGLFLFMGKEAPQNLKLDVRRI